jgi:hypothetical protein
VQQAIRAINRQIHDDFASHWGISGTLRLEGRSAAEPDKIDVADMRRDAVLDVWNKSDVDDALGYHFTNNRGIPYGFVFLDVAKVVENWTVTLSHEALELIADPESNLLVVEMCDAVQTETYKMDGVAVSNFVLPLYFTGTRDTDDVGARNDFLGTRAKDGSTLRSFGINDRGYIGFFDPEKNDHDTFMVRGSKEAQKRVIAKEQIRAARRSVKQRDRNVREHIGNLAMKVRGAANVRNPPRSRVSSFRFQKTKTQGRFRAQCASAFTSPTPAARSA